MLFTLLFLLFTATFSSHSTASSYSDDLRYHLPDEDILTLQITANDRQHDIPVVRYAARHAITKGVTIIIGDIQPDGNIDAKLLFLAKVLPDWGWNTLLVMPRFDYLAPILDINIDDAAADIKAPVDDADLESTQVSDASVDDDTLANIANSNNNVISPQVGIKPNHLQAPHLPYTKQDYVNFISILTKELNSAFTQGAGYQIIYVKGQSASAMIDSMSQQDHNFAHALVVDNPYWPSTDVNRLLPGKLAKLPMPVLDLISLSGNLWAKDTISTRRVAAKIGLKSLYRQREVFGEQLLGTGHGDLSKELVSWTHFLGW